MQRSVRFALAAAALFASMAAHAHTAPSGWAYDPQCCGGMDCAPIPASAVREQSGGFYVTLEAGQHPMVKKHWERFIPYGLMKPSGDGEFHICIRGDNPAYIAPSEPICFYVPTGA